MTISTKIKGFYSRSRFNWVPNLNLFFVVVVVVWVFVIETRSQCLLVSTRVLYSLITRCSLSQKRFAFNFLTLNTGKNSVNFLQINV